MTIQLLDNVINPEPVGATSNKGVFAGPEVPAQSLAPRLDTLEGKTVYLIDIGYGGSYKFMQAIQRWLGKNMPSVKTVRKRTPSTFLSERETAFFEEIKAGGDAAVIGVGG
ncbi:MAG: hypothetical protein A2169_07945 [Deltaproteobacteria bacterium RBG_13_47_9]|nr:MAG: hypothetical protein A2169_07945 [Deltaproteobacteria bacterium RBG_13_47_9]